VLAEVLPEGSIEPTRISRGLGIACRHAARVESFPLPKRDGWVARLSPSEWPQLKRPIEIVNVHILGPHTWPYFPSRATRRGQLRGLLEFLDRDPGVPRAILGDFNASPCWSVYRRMAARFTDAAIACAGSGVAPRPTWPHFPSLGVSGLIRIDHCFVSGLTPLHAQVVPIKGSDHFGLCVDLGAEPAG
jgi:endonuclease/exonuclease/phosphatase (EEP) superfamily protein YafD